MISHGAPGCLPFTEGNRLVHRLPKLTVRSWVTCGWPTVCANGKQNHPNGKFRSRLACAIFMQFSLIYSESGTSFTIAAGPGKSKWDTIFCLDTPVENFGLPLKTFRSCWKFSSRANQKSLTIYSPTEFPRFFW